MLYKIRYTRFTAPWFTYRTVCYYLFSSFYHSLLSFIITCYPLFYNFIISSSICSHVILSFLNLLLSLLSFLMCYSLFYPFIFSVITTPPPPLYYHYIPFLLFSMNTKHCSVLFTGRTLFQPRKNQQDGQLHNVGKLTVLFVLISRAHYIFMNLK